MSKSINLDVVSVLDEYAILCLDNGNEIDVDLEYLPQNLKAGQTLKFIISLADVTTGKTAWEKPKEFIPNGKSLSY